MTPVTLALATARLTRLVVHDDLTEPLRWKVDEWAQGAPRFSRKERIQLLVNCPKCASVWAGAAILVASRVPGVRHLVTVLALSEVTVLTGEILEWMQDYQSHDHTR